MTTVQQAHPTETADVVAPVVKRNDGRIEDLVIAFGWLLALAYGYFIPSIVSWNTESHLYPAFSMIDRQSVNIDPYHGGLGDRAYWRGHYYSDKAPGMAFLAVPVYAGLRLAFPQLKSSTLHYVHQNGEYFFPAGLAYARYAITFLLVSLPSVLLALLLWVFLLRVSSLPGWSLSLTATYALGTPAFVYSIWYYSHQLCAVLLFTSFALAFYFARGRSPSAKGLAVMVGAGLLAGYSIISEYPTAVIVFLIAVYIAVVSRKRLLWLGAFALGFLPPAILNMGYNVAAFGQPFATGYMHVHSSAYHSNIHGGLFGLANPFSYGVQSPSVWSFWQVTFSAYRGLFVFSPVLLLFIPGLYFMWRRRDLRPEWWLFLAIVVLYFLVDASRGQDTNGWSGGSSVTSRHLVPMLPFMVVPIVFCLRNTAWRAIFVVFAAYSVAVMMLTVAATYPFPYGDKNPLANEVLHNTLTGHVEPNWISLFVTGFHTASLETLLPGLVIGLALLGWILWLFLPHPLRAGYRPAGADGGRVATE